MMLFASAGRGVLLALLLAMVITSIFYKGVARPFFRIQLIALITGLSVHTLLFRIIPLFLVDPMYSGSVLTGSMLRLTTWDRVALWKRALTMIQEHPFFGVGPMHYAWYPNNVAAHPHNSLMQIAAEWGLPATLLVLFIFGYGLFNWVKKFNHITLLDKAEIDSHLPIILFFTLIASAIYSLVDGVIVMPMSQVMMAVVVGLMFGTYSSSKKSQIDEVNTRSNIGYRVFAGIVLATLLWTIKPDAILRLTGNSQNVPFNIDVVGPRFWLEGGIPH
jgi:putative inorganic carbon (hco3(-)) transporter